MPYIDDFLVYPKSFISHVDLLRLTVRRLLKQEVRYLVCIETTYGYRLDSKNIQSCDRSKTKTQDVRRSDRNIEMVGYFRKYIADFCKRKHGYVNS